MSLIHSSVVGYLSSFCYHSYCKKSCNKDRSADFLSNWCFCILWVYSYEWSGTIGSDSQFIFSVSRILCTTFHCCWTSLHYHQHYKRAPFSPHPCQHFVVASCLTLVLSCISVIIFDVEQFFIHLLAFSFLLLRSVFLVFLPIF